MRTHPVIESLPDLSGDSALFESPPKCGETLVDDMKSPVRDDSISTIKKEAV